MPKPKLLFLNRSYWPDSEATGQLLTVLCESLTEDFDVTVIAGMPNHTHAAEEHFHYGKSVHNNVTIQRVRHTRFSKHSIIGRLTNLITFTFSAFIRSFRQGKLNSPDIVITETDPFFLPLLGPWLKWWYGCKFVAYLQDVYPDVAIAVGKAKEGFLTRRLRNMLVKAYRKADRVIVLSSNMRSRCEANGVPNESMRIVHNWANCENVYPVKVNNPFRVAHQLSGKFVVMYSGNLGMAHILMPLIEAATELQSDPQIVFMLIGEGVHKAKLQAIAEERSLSNVKFLSYQPREELANSLSAADVHVVSMLPEAEGCVMPSKLYGILASGTAVLSLCEEASDVSRIVTEHKVGVVCDPADSTTLTLRLVNKIRDMADNRTQTEQQGKIAREVCLEQYDQPIQLEQFSNLMQELIEPESDNATQTKPTTSPQELTSCEC